MVIRAKSNVQRTDIQIHSKDEAAEKFINGATNGAVAAKTGESDRENKKPAMIRFDPALLKEIDAAAKHEGISRSAWISSRCRRALDARKRRAVQ